MKMICLVFRSHSLFLSLLAICLLLLGVSCSSIFAQRNSGEAFETAFAALDAEQVLLSTDDLFSNDVIDTASPPQASRRLLKNGAGEKTLLVSIEEPLDAPYTIHLPGPLGKGPLMVDDLLVLKMHLRSVSSTLSSDRTRLRVDLKTTGCEKQVRHSVALAVDSRWKEIIWPVRLRCTPLDAQIAVELAFGRTPQSIEISRFELLNMGEGVAQTAVRSKGFEYEGQDPEALWRQEAQSRIERYRKAPIRVIVTDRAGNPVPGAFIRLEMKRHAFQFGTAVDARLLTEDSPSGDVYRRYLIELFNSAVPENGLKMMTWQGEWQEPSRETTLAALGWLEAHNFFVRGHALVWPQWQFVPQRIAALRGDPKRLQQAILQHIQDILKSTHGLVDEWDVLNEPFIGRGLLDMLDRRAVADWFFEARRASGSVPLYLNDFDIIESPDRLNSRFCSFSALARDLRASGVPLDGLGLQGHFSDWQLRPIPEVLRILDELATLSLKLKITEYDLDISDEMLQADYTRDFMTAAFSHPAVDGFYFWGFWQQRHWRPEAALLRSDWSERPAAKAYRDLVYDRWWTRADGQTDHQGIFETRAFLGEFKITVSVEGREVTQEATLNRPGRTLRIQADK